MKMKEVDIDIYKIMIFLNTLSFFSSSFPPGGSVRHPSPNSHSTTPFPFSFIFLQKDLKMQISTLLNLLFLTTAVQATAIRRRADIGGYARGLAAAGLGLNWDDIVNDLGSDDLGDGFVFPFGVSNNRRPAPVRPAPVTRPRTTSKPPVRATSTKVALAATTLKPSTKPATTSKPASSTAGGANAAYTSVALERHNIHRRNHSAPDMVWNAELAGYAKTVADSCKFAHDLFVYPFPLPFPLSLTNSPLLEHQAEEATAKTSQQPAPPTPLFHQKTPKSTSPAESQTNGTTRNSPPSYHPTTDKRLLICPISRLGDTFRRSFGRGVTRWDVRLLIVRRGRSLRRLLGVGIRLVIIGAWGMWGVSMGIILGVRWDVLLLLRRELGEERWFLLKL